MTTLQLIANVTLQLLRRELRLEEVTEGVARFLLDRLTGAQVAEICRQILTTSDLCQNLEVKIPETLVADHIEEYQLPASILTSERTVYWRNAPCAKSAILLANTNDDQSQSLQDVTAISAKELKRENEFWVNAASTDLGLNSQETKWWEQALKGLQAANDYSLEQVAAYIASTRAYLLENIGNPNALIEALGWSLSELRLPRDSSYFHSTISIDKRTQMLSWKKAFRQVIAKRGCLLLKETPARKVITNEELQESFLRVQAEIPVKHHAVVKQFARSLSGWNASAQALANLEWTRDNLELLFTGIQPRKLDLATQTIHFYDSSYPDSLLLEEHTYLRNLKKRGVKEVIEQDVEFYEKHRLELAENRSLYGRWNRFIYGQAIECTDFLLGLATALERLVEQVEDVSATYSLVIRTQFDKTRKKWLTLNADVGNYFCTRYRGLEKLLGPRVKWETHWLFKYDQLLAEAEKQKSTRKRTRYRRNTVVTRVATEIKFNLELSRRSDATTEFRVDNDAPKVGLIWRCDPKQIGLQLADDLRRLRRDSERTFVLHQVNREPISKEGNLQAVSLHDIGTLMAAFGQDRGSLVSRYNPKNDLNKLFRERLLTLSKEGRLTAANVQILESAWQDFKASYGKALDEFLTGEGLASDAILVQIAAYERLLDTFLTIARGDRNRWELLAPLLYFGSVAVDCGKPVTIIPPWHPLRLAAIAIKARQMGNLVDYILSSTNINFGDTRLFFKDLRAELQHPYYPEVAVSGASKTALLLSISDTVNDYSLMERPVRSSADLSTNEDPQKAVSIILALIEHYLELLPHEKNNLSLVLYNCDSTRLPQAVVNKLSAMNEAYDEVRCQIHLRHRDPRKLNKLYQELLETSDTDPDTFVASEAARDFMAKLRIGVMVDRNPLPERQNGKLADIVFLQDVISRQAEEVWVSPPILPTVPLVEHIPPRWSKKRPARIDELKATTYLVSPCQPAVLRSYVKAVYCLIKQVDSADTEDFLPARQVSFHNETIRAIFEEAHRLGEWVVNYDELLERRLLTNFGVRIIRHQQHRNNERHLLVSSTTALNLLQVLVKNRLARLTPQLSDDESHELTTRFIKEASEISGDIVLRAAKQGKFAAELIGVVLSKLLITEELGPLVAWYFLDDYAFWWGQDGGQIADILALAPQVAADGTVSLQLVITEAKFVGAENVLEARKNSYSQLHQTVWRVEQALYQDMLRLDRGYWLTKLGDLLMQGLDLPHDFPLSLETLATAIRQGQVPIQIRGYSHVFLHSEGLGPLSRQSSQTRDNKLSYCWQEVFSREQVTELLLAYHRTEPLSLIRQPLPPLPPPCRPNLLVDWAKTTANAASVDVNATIVNDAMVVTDAIAPVNSAPRPAANSVAKSTANSVTASITDSINSVTNSVTSSVTDSVTDSTSVASSITTAIGRVAKPSTVLPTIATDSVSAKEVTVAKATKVAASISNAADATDADTTVKANTTAVDVAKVVNATTEVAINDAVTNDAATNDTVTNDGAISDTTTSNKIVNLATQRVENIVGSTDKVAPKLGTASVWPPSGLSAWMATQRAAHTDPLAAAQWLATATRTLSQALESYGLRGPVLGNRLTPNAALIRLKGSNDLRLEGLERKRSELLTTHALDIIDISGRPGEIVVALARPQREAISLVNIWARRKVNATVTGNNLSLLLGCKEIDGELLYLNLGSNFAGLEHHAPHSLVAGSTGSGKSVLLRNLLLDICATNHPTQAQIYLIDPKMGVDYQFIEDMPHLREQIIIKQEMAAQVLESLVNEMDRRYLEFREQRVSNLLAYNEKVPATQRLPVLWLVHDEFAEWMLQENYRETVSAMVQRLGIKARAAGIYLIFAAQRPDATVLPVQLRDNLGNRLILRVESVGTSEIALGRKGAERLLGKGHLAARLSGEPDIIYAQVPFLTDAEIIAAAELIRQEFCRELPQNNEDAASAVKC
jgi:DNA segregation ATPase FtsK/SpoIIIE, S-DNA-T family